VQVIGDRPDRRRDDRLVERGEEHPEDQADQDGHDLPVSETARLDRGRRRRPRPLILGRRVAHPRSCGSMPGAGGRERGS